MMIDYWNFNQRYAAAYMNHANCGTAPAPALIRTVSMQNAFAFLLKHNIK
jgi:hypothetical protein